VLLISGAILVVGLGGYRLGLARAPASSRSESMARAAQPSDDARLRALELQVGALRSELRRSQAARPDARELAEGEPGALEAPAAAEPVTDEELRKREEEQERRAEADRSELLQGLSDRVDTEVRDPAWLREMEARISKIFPAELGSDVSLDEVTCAGTACRVSIDHPGSDRLAQERVARLLLRIGSFGPMQVHFDLEERGKTTAYLVRSDAQGRATE
jgi:hypothetical protein